MVGGVRGRIDFPSQPELVRRLVSSARQRWRAEAYHYIGKGRAPLLVSHQRGQLLSADCRVETRASRELARVCDHRQQMRDIRRCCFPSRLVIGMEPEAENSEKPWILTKRIEALKCADRLVFRLINLSVLSKTYHAKDFLKVRG